MPDHVLLDGLDELLRHGHHHTARLLAHLGEVDARALYATHGHPSMFRFCVDQLHMSEGTAYKRIGAARLARRHPEVLEAIAEGRLHLSAVMLLAPHLNTANLRDLLEAATHASKASIEQMLAERFPRPDLPSRIRMLVPATSGNELSPGTVHAPSADPPSHEATACRESASSSNATAENPTISASLLDAFRMTRASSDDECTSTHTPAPPSHASTSRSRVSPTAPRRYALQTTLDEQAHADLRAIQAMLSHAIPSHDLGEVLGRALALCRELLEKQRTRETGTPRTPRANANAHVRHIAAHVRREVWRRDGQRCTFIGPDGQRCASRSFLELDHVVPVARGGTGTAGNLRVRCRAHNQHEADRVFGAAFMRAHRERAHGPMHAGT